MRTSNRLRPTSSFRFAPLATALACALGAPGAMGAIYTVSSSTDDGSAGTLRYAINTVNAGACTGDTIAMSGAPLTILVSGTFPLPPVTCNNVTIQGGGWTLDGTSLVPNGAMPFCALEGGAIGTATGISDLEIRNFISNGYGTAVCGWVNASKLNVHDNHDGIVTTGGASTVTASKVYNHPLGTGIEVSGTGSVVGGAGTSRNLVYGNNIGIVVSSGGLATNNFVGTPDGVTAAPNGIGIQTSSATVDGNLVSSSTASGILMFDGTVSNNHVGMNGTLNPALANAAGIVAQGSGGLIQGNFISGNNGTGITGSYTNGLTVTGNTIGLDDSGSAPLPNTGVGIGILCAYTLSVLNNTVSANSAGGILLGSVTSSSRVWGNKVGTSASGSAAIGNSGIGIAVTAPGCDGPPSQGIDFYKNLVAYNSADGIRIVSGDGHRITESSVFANGGKNINLDFDGGPLLNDGLDADSGPNNRQNYPVVTAAQGASSTTINFTLNSVPNASYFVEFYANTSGGAPAGQTYLGGTIPFTTDASGNASGTKTYSGLLDNITAVAISTGTDTALPPAFVAGDTSEFSLVATALAAPAATVSPATVNFGNVVIGGGSATTTIGVSSNGGQPYVIQSITTSPLCTGGPICAGGDFMCSTTCANLTPYSPGASCAITASFAPNIAGSQTTSFYICDNTGASPRTITLSGNGIVPPPLAVFPASHDYGSVLVDSRSGPWPFRFINPGTSPVSIGPVTVGPNFEIASNSCGPSIAPGAECLAEVVFAPKAAGPLSGFVGVSTAASSSVGASLTGNGSQMALIVLPQSVDLGSYTLGSTAPLVRLIELKNSGNAVLTFASITATGPFTVDNPCPINLAPGASCTLKVSFKAATKGAFTGAISVVTNAVGGSGSIALTARAQVSASPDIHVTPAIMGFGDRAVGSPSPTQRVTITNEGGAPATLAPLTIGVEFLLVNTTCGLTLEPSATCFADVAMRALGFGLRTGQLLVNSNAAGSPHSVTLIGTGCRPFSASGNRRGVRSNCSP